MGTGVAGITLWASIPGENPQALLTAGGPSGPCTFPFVEGDEVTISASWTSEETTPSVSQCWWDTYAPAGTGVATTALAGGTPHNLSCK
jgi:hypothetical protein